MWRKDMALTGFAAVSATACCTSRKSKRAKVSPSVLKSNLDDAPLCPCVPVPVPQISSGEESFQNPENLWCIAGDGGEPFGCLFGLTVSSFEKENAKVLANAGALSPAASAIRYES